MVVPHDSKPHGAKFDRFVTWLQVGGCVAEKVGIRASYAAPEAGHGLVAISPIDTGERIITLPSSLHLSLGPPGDLRSSPCLLDSESIAKVVIS